ncbi:MAG: biopolymer transporter ExbD [Gammaproteobacteria bacterium]|nr:biopolymer transporter ExbD [Pseudomonadota bacterium]TDJ27870.1 MAG: biopolymer transporter ExbD [Gammaproteobacteria bacterium]
MKFISTTPVEEVNINLTPLIDVVFLLLIFFMVSTTFDTTSELKITLPEASDQPSANVPEKLNIMIDSEGRFYLNSRELTNKKSATLMAAVERALNGSDIPVVIQSDAASPVQSLVTAMDVLGKLGLSRVSIATTRPLE